MNSWEKKELLRATRSLCWGRGAAAGLIVAPCGSCRQALVPGEQIVQARDLLPFAGANPSNPHVARPSRHALRSHDEEEESYFVTWQV